MSLEELRKKIDENDARIVRLIAERIKLAKEIGERRGIRENK
jgi:chorismate mutase